MVLSEDNGPVPGPNDLDLFKSGGGHRKSGLVVGIKMR